jgi:hypothetical protein
LYFANEVNRWASASNTHETTDIRRYGDAPACKAYASRSHSSPAPNPYSESGGGSVPLCSAGGAASWVSAGGRSVGVVGADPSGVPSGENPYSPLRRFSVSPFACASFGSGATASSGVPICDRFEMRICALPLPPLASAGWLKWARASNTWSAWVSCSAHCCDMADVGAVSVNFARLLDKITNCRLDWPTCIDREFG